jgi:hypothetical protein
MPVKLPGPLVGTDAQPEPKSTALATAAVGGVVLGDEPDEVLVVLVHAARTTAPTTKVATRAFGLETWRCMTEPSFV